jgi:hypothetical protein
MSYFNLQLHTKIAVSFLSGGVFRTHRMQFYQGPKGEMILAAKALLGYIYFPGLQLEV